MRRTFPRALSRRTAVAGLAAGMVGGGWACRRASQPEHRTTAATGPGGSTETDAQRAAAEAYAARAFSLYEAAVAGARGLQSAIERFVAAPAEPELAVARKAWLAARPPYLLTEALRFYGGPIDALETKINAWPIDERFVDTGKGVPGLGLIQDTRALPEITGAAIAALNERDGETSISTGYHAIEFLLWGEDTDAAGPGRRPAADYTAPTPHAGRRARYLIEVTRLLLSHLERVRDAWAPRSADNYRAALVAAPPLVALGRAFRGLAMLAGPELSGERLTVALETKDQEDEHSCFSDNTCNDIVFDVQGLRDAYLGLTLAPGAKATAPARDSLHALVLARDPELAPRVLAATGAALDAARAIPPPFDQAIRGTDDAPGRRAVRATVLRLRALSDAFARAAAALGARVDG